MTAERDVALVTGATRGIGKAIAVELARAGARVIGTATSPQGAATITEFLAEEPTGGEGRVLDVTDAAAVDDLVANVSNEFGTITILVNNAGITRDNLLMRMKDEEWDSIIDTNLSAVYRTCKACLRGMMKARRGRIVNIASVVGATGNAGQTNYAAAKAGMIGFTRSLAREVASRRITVNTVAPGFIETDMTRTLPEAQQNALLAQVPLNRLGEPTDVAHAVVFLASRQASYITGQVLHVNGGMYMG